MSYKSVLYMTLSTSTAQSRCPSPRAEDIGHTVTGAIGMSYFKECKSDAR
jgi:hypothetical protein